MNNLYLPDIDLSEVPDLNLPHYGFWSLKNESAEEYRAILNLFTPAECNNIIKIGRAFHQQESSTFASIKPGFSDVRRSITSWLLPNEVTGWIYHRLDAAIKRINSEHYNFDLCSIEHLQFTEYSEKYSGKYGCHLDRFGTAVTPNSHRKLSFSIQLCEPEVYEGGDLLIYNENTPAVAEKSIGCMNLFPSFTLHEVKPVTKGLRSALVGWVSGPKFK